MSPKKILLSVAGFDPTSGAGITLDLNVFQKYGYHGMGIPTSLTSQNTQNVKKVHCPPPSFLSAQYRHLRTDVAFSGIKIGMIGCTENIPVIAKILSDNPNIPKIIDPVFKSSAGNRLIKKKSISIYMDKIRGSASLITPNLMEAEWISSCKIGTVADMKISAKSIFNLTLIPCLIKGGHLIDQNTNILFDGKRYFQFKNRKLKKTVHGTGCFLSSAILCHLVNGSPLEQAVLLAGEATHKAIKLALKLGKGQLIIGDIP